MVFGLITSPRDVFPVVVAAEMGRTVLLRIPHRGGRARRGSAGSLPAENMGGGTKSGRDGNFGRPHQRAGGTRNCDRQQHVGI
jgi:hypothetical protein